MAEENTQEQYVVLARKYRPQNFEDLMGQDALVQTLTNAINNNRLHHAYILTGIRGVGKTTTARLIAKALNCTGPDGKGGPTSHPCGICENCKSIAAGRNIDVLELDAASRTGVDDVREILDGVRYKPTNSRYKVYIIDEVHMLSKNAFNALLKTLEEPPSHVKFVFATTEIRKVPVTVLSRCQRFDLQRLSIEDLMKLFHKIVKAEGLPADEEALQLIAAAADGSARDGESLMDQAISLGNGKIRADIVKDMLGMADRGQAYEMFELMISGDMTMLLTKVRESYQNGVNPVTLLHDLIDITHTLTKTILIASFINDVSISDSEKTFLKNTSAKVNVAILSRIWQMLIKGLSEVQYAPVPIDALEMVLIRIAYSANLPSPAEVLESVKKKSSLVSQSNQNPAAQNFSADKAGLANPNRFQPSVNNVSYQNNPTFASGQAAENFVNKNHKAESKGKLENIHDLITLLEKHKQPRLVYAVKNDMEICGFEQGNIQFKANERVSNEFLTTINKILEEETGHKWTLDILPGQVNITLAGVENAQKESDKKNIAETPLVKSILTEFSGAKIETLTRKIETTEEDDQSSEFSSPDLSEDLFVSED